jgi:hypothetical protein
VGPLAVLPSSTACCCWLLATLASASIFFLIALQNNKVGVEQACDGLHLLGFVLALLALGYVSAALHMCREYEMRNSIPK